MYDKNKFITEYAKGNKITKAHLEMIFGWVKEFEDVWKMDFALQNERLLEDAINQIVGIRKQSAEHVLIILKDYVRWLIDNGYDATTNIEKINVSTLNQKRQSMVPSPQYLRMVMKYAFNDSSMETSDCVLRVFLWMGFSGMSCLEALNVTSQQVDLKKMCINYNGKKFNIPKESKADFEAACTLEAFDDTKYRKDGTVLPRKIQRRPGDYIMRGAERKTAKDLSLNTLENTIRPQVARKFKAAEEKKQAVIKSGRHEKICDYGFNLSFERVFLSGVFYRMFEKEKAGYPVDFRQDAIRDMDIKRSRGKEYIETPNNTIEKHIVRNMREFRNDYIVWKEAFELK